MTNLVEVAGRAPWYQTRAGMRLCRFDTSLAAITVASMDYCSGAYGFARMVIDREGQAGYLTAAD